MLCVYCIRIGFKAVDDKLVVTVKLRYAEYFNVLYYYGFVRAVIICVNKGHTSLFNIKNIVRVI